MVMTGQHIQCEAGTLWRSRENKGGCWLSMRCVRESPFHQGDPKVALLLCGRVPSGLGPAEPARAGVALSGAAEPTAQQGTAAPPCASGSAEQLQCRDHMLVVGGRVLVPLSWLR